jgi:2',3'-cyclic-nucleotide 2'-phosphodiesterase (5'-nucleotidase family)
MLLLLLLACGPKTPAAPPTSGPHALTVLHTNDIHAHFEPEPAEWLDGRPTIGGFVRLEQEVRAVRAARGAGQTLTVDGGDQLTGTPITELEEAGSFGGAMHALFERVGYDAWVVGNHEFDKGLDNLSRYSQNHPMLPLSCNLLALGSAKPLLPQQELSHVYAVAGMRVGVIGVTTDKLAGLMNKRDFARMTLAPESAAVQAEVNRLDPATDLIVVLSHIGVESDKRLASDVQGIDLIVGAHSHTRLTSALRVGDTWIVQAGSYNRSLGIVDLVADEDHITELRYELRDLLPDTATVAPDPEMQETVATYKKSIDRVYGETVSNAPRCWDAPTTTRARSGVGSPTRCAIAPGQTSPSTMAVGFGRTSLLDRSPASRCFSASPFKMRWSPSSSAGKRCSTSCSGTSPPTQTKSVAFCLPLA